MNPAEVTVHLEIDSELLRRLHHLERANVEVLTWHRVGQTVQRRIRFVGARLPYLRLMLPPLGPDRFLTALVVDEQVEEILVHHPDVVARGRLRSIGCSRTVEALDLAGRCMFNGPYARKIGVSVERARCLCEEVRLAVLHRSVLF